MNKRKFIRFAWAALAGVAALACSREVMEPAEPVESGNVRKVTFHALETKSKAQFGEKEGDVWPTLWTDNDTKVKLSLNYGSAIEADVTTSEDHRSATFSATIDFGEDIGPYTYYSVSPSSVAKALSPSREAWKVSIPSVQTPSAGSPDESALIIASTSDTYQDTDAASNVDLYFNHLTAYGCISLTGLDLSGQTVKAVEITATEPFVGDWYWKCVSHELIDYGASSTLTINTNHADDVWFGCAPVDMSGQIWVVSLVTDAGTYKKEILLDGTYELQAGVVAVISVDMSTDTDFIQAGSSGSGGNDVVVLSEEFDNSTTSDSSSAFSSSKFSNFSGSTDKAYTSKYGGVKLGSSSASGYITSKSLDLSSSFTVTLNVLQYGYDTGNVQVTVGDVTKEITPTETDTAYSLDFDAATSTSTVKIGTSTKRAYIDNVIITRHDGGSGSSADDPLLQKTIYGGYLGSGLEWEYNPGTDQVTRSYDSNGFQTYTLIDPSDVEELEITGYKKVYVKDGSNISISVNWRRGASTVLSEVYTMTIIKEDGPKVWLSDGTHGVIIKK